MKLRLNIHLPLLVSAPLLLGVFVADATASVLHASVRQGDYSTRIGQPIRVVAEMTAEKDLAGCAVTLANQKVVGLGYQFTQGQDGPRIGTANTPMDLKARVPQALWLIIAPRVLLENAQIELAFTCADGTRADHLPTQNTLPLTVNAPFLENEPGSLWYRESASAGQQQDCTPWPVEHVYRSFDTTLLIRITAARVDDAHQADYPKLGTVTLDYDVEEVLRGSDRILYKINGPLGVTTASNRAPNTIIPLGSRFIVSAQGGTIRWENCSQYWMVPVDETNSCQLYRYRRLADNAEPYNEQCEAESILSYLQRLEVPVRVPNDTDRLESLKAIWYDATGLRWDGKPVPDKILFRSAAEQRMLSN